MGGSLRFPTVLQYSSRKTLCSSFYLGSLHLIVTVMFLERSLIYGEEKKKKSQRNWKLGRGGLLVFCSHKLSATHTWPLKGCVRWNNSPGSAAPHVSASLCARCSCRAYHITPSTASVLACHSSEAPRPVNSNSQENCGAALELQDHGHLADCPGPVFGA